MNDRAAARLGRERGKGVRAKHDWATGLFIPVAPGMNYPNGRKES